MKKHNLLFAIGCLALTSINAQILKKTFYDYNKTLEKEVYYVNSKGEKNGSFKFYSEFNGVLREEANFKNGLLNGVYKLYWVGNGKAQLEKSETYVDGIKNGIASYYGGKNYAVRISQGNYVNGKKEGVWKAGLEIDGEMPAGFEFVIFNQVYKDDKLIEESNTGFYYPSNKIYSEIKKGTRFYYSPYGKTFGEEVLDSSGVILEDKWFYPNGKLKSSTKNILEKGTIIKEISYWYENGVLESSTRKYVEEGQNIEEKSTWYENSKVKTNKIFISNSLVLFESYKTDGSKDEEMLRFEKEHKTGKFKILFNQNFEEISDETKCVYYRDIEYQDGKPFGKVKEYYVTGEVLREFYLKSETPDVKYGILKEYYKNGKLHFVINYNSQSLPDGKALTYYESGNLSDSSVFEFGELKYSISYNQNLNKSHEKILISRYEWTQLSQKGVAFPPRSKETEKERKTYFYFDYYDNGNFKIKGKSFIDDDKKTKFFDKLEHYSEAGVLEKTEIYDSSGQLKK